MSYTDHIITLWSIDYNNYSMFIISSYYVEEKILYGIINNYN